MSGEQHVYDTPSVAVSSFHFPNCQNLKGIGLHTHQKCDDVELVIDGSPCRIVGFNEVEKIPPTTLIVNPPDSPHSLLQLDEQESTVLSFRFPRDYKGKAFSANAFNELSRTAPKSWIFDLNSDDNRLIYTTSRSYAYLTNKHLYLDRKSKETIFVALSKYLKLKTESQIIELERGDILVLNSFNKLRTTILDGRGVELGSC